MNHILKTTATVLGLGLAVLGLAAALIVGRVLRALLYQTGSFDPLVITTVTLLLTARHHAYQPGTLVLHSGHMLHQIAPVPSVEPDDERIALQGHGIFYDGGWKLYW